MLSVLFNASIVVSESTQNKIDKNEYDKSNKYDNAIKNARSSAVKIEYPFPI